MVTIEQTLFAVAFWLVAASLAVALGVARYLAGLVVVASGGGLPVDPVLPLPVVLGLRLLPVFRQSLVVLLMLLCFAAGYGVALIADLYPTRDYYVAPVGDTGHPTVWGYK